MGRKGHREVRTILEHQIQDDLTLGPKTRNCAVYGRNPGRRTTVFRTSEAAFDGKQGSRDNGNLLGCPSSGPQI
jgi:hypothetical protein